MLIKPKLMISTNWNRNGIGRCLCCNVILFIFAKQSGHIIFFKLHIQINKICTSLWLQPTRHTPQWSMTFLLILSPFSVASFSPFPFLVQCVLHYHKPSTTWTVSSNTILFWCLMFQGCKSHDEGGHEASNLYIHCYNTSVCVFALFLIFFLDNVLLTSTERPVFFLDWIAYYYSLPKQKTFK
jgi:hypothetical protein